MAEQNMKMGATLNENISNEDSSKGDDQTAPKDLQELIGYVQDLLQHMQDKFQAMSDQVLGRIDDMSHRIEDLEKNINDLVQHAGIEQQQIQSSGQGQQTPQQEQKDEKQ